jgi:hypothetical protein
MSPTPFLRGRIHGLVLTALGLMLGMAGPARALTVAAPTFAHLVEASEQIARVEVTGLSARWDPTPTGGRIIHTYVQCRVLRLLKGPAADAVTLRVMGGQVGDRRIVIPDLPSFDRGASYVLFIAGNNRAFFPLVAAGYGLYRIQRDPAGVERIIRANGSPLRTLDDTALPAADPRPRASAPAAPTDAMTVAAFETSILHALHPVPAT